MSNKETKARVANAFRAMKAIGITEDKVKPVLKSLLKLYDKNWELIEEENYRALADAIFERDDSEAVEQSKKTATDEAAEPSNQIVTTQETENHVEKEVQATDEPERPSKRLRPRYQEGQTSSLNTSSSGVPKTPLVRPKDEPNELPETNPPKMDVSQSLAESPQPTAEKIMTRSQALTSQSLDKDKGKQPISPKSTETSKRQQNTQVRTESRSQSHPMRLRFRAAGTRSSQVPSKQKTPVPESSSNDLRLKEAKVEPGILLSPKRKSTAGHPLIVPKDEPVTGDMPPLDVSITTVYPDNLNEEDSLSRNGKICGNDLPEPSALQSSEKETTDGSVALNEPRKDTEPAMVSGDHLTTLELASSPAGEVKISLNCNLARGRPDFHIPSLEAVVKAVDHKCLRSPQTLDPNLSVMNLMKEMCQSFLKLGTDSNNDSPETLDVSSTIGSVNKSILNVSVGSQSDANLVMPKTPLLPPPCNAINDGSQQNKMDDGEEIVTNKENEENFSEETNDMSLEVVKQSQVTPEIIRQPHDVFDIAKGQEKVVITLANDVNDECPSFYYIPQNAPYQNAYVNFSLARIGDNNSCSTCSGDCLSLSVPCACANETGGEFAYTPNGLVKEELLKECISMNRNPSKHCQFFCKECPLERSKCEDIIEPCKGHLVRKFIKECWWKCGCTKQCGNRVVQRGITRNLQVFMAPGGKGWGLRTLEDLPKGAFVCEYVGEVLTNAELFDRVSRSPEGEKHSYPVLLDADWCAEGVLKDEEALCLDATYYGNVARFINHRCYDSTLVEIPVEVETPDHHYYHLAFFTTRKVKAMEELTWDYGIDFDDHEHPIKAFRCQCGSKFCRNIKRSRRSRR